jgi:glycerol-3-phosphate dehydrogenase
VHLDDLLLRRTRIGLLVEQGGLIFEDKIKSICCQELNWTDQHWQIERERYKSIWNKYYSIPV